MEEVYWQIEDALLYEGSRRLISSQGTKSLRPQQYRVLLSLLENKGHVTRKEALTELLWKRHELEDEHRLQSLIWELKRTLGKHHAIETITGSGYLWSGSALRIDPATRAHSPEVSVGVVPPQPQKVRWGPVDNKPAGISIDGYGLFIPWTYLKVEIEQKLLNQLGRHIPIGCTVELLEFHERKDWRVRIVSPEHKKLRVWFGPDPEKDWAYDGLVRIGEVPTDYIAIVWQIFQRYSDGTYRLIRAKCPCGYNHIM